MTIEQLVRIAAETIIEHGNYNYYVNNCHTFSHNFLLKIVPHSQGSALGLISAERYLNMAFNNPKITENQTINVTGNIAITYLQAEFENKKSQSTFYGGCVLIILCLLFLLLSMLWFLNSLINVIIKQK